MSFDATRFRRHRCGHARCPVEGARGRERGRWNSPVDRRSDRAENPGRALPPDAAPDHSSPSPRSPRMTSRWLRSTLAAALSAVAAATATAADFTDYAPVVATAPVYERVNAPRQNAGPKQWRSSPRHRPRAPPAMAPRRPGRSSAHHRRRRRPPGRQWSRQGRRHGRRCRHRGADRQHHRQQERARCRRRVRRAPSSARCSAAGPSIRAGRHPWLRRHLPLRRPRRDGAPAVRSGREVRVAVGIVARYPVPATAAARRARSLRPRSIATAAGIPGGRTHSWTAAGACRRPRPPARARARCLGAAPAAMIRIP